MGRNCHCESCELTRHSILIFVASGSLGTASHQNVNLRTIHSESVLSRRVSQVEVNLLERLFDRSPDVAFFVKDAAGKYVAVNDSLVERHGCRSKTQVIGKCPRDICPGDFGRIPTEQDEKVLSSGRPLIDHLEMHWHRPNDPVWCLTTKLPILDADGTVVGLIGFSRDVRVQVPPSEIPEDFAQALDEFEQHLSADVTPAWLARRSKLTPQRLARLMKRLFGLTPNQFIAKARIAAASRMLQDSQRSIAEIAHACGFSDHSAFTRAFRSATGVTPSEFRTRQ
jgi:PAS domain S-box-containing protein